MVPDGMMDFEKVCIEDNDGLSCVRFAGPTTFVKVKGLESKEFEVRVGIQQTSVFNSLLFIIVVDQFFSREY